MAFEHYAYIGVYVCLALTRDHESSQNQSHQCRAGACGTDASGSEAEEIHDNRGDGRRRPYERAEREDLKPVLDIHAYRAGGSVEKAAVRKRVYDRPARMKHCRRRERGNSSIEESPRERLRGDRHAGRSRRRRAGQEKT